MNYVIIIISMVFVNNFVLVRFLGLCPFLGVSKKTDSAFGMGLAVTFVMALASSVTWALFNFVLVPGPKNILGLRSPEMSLLPVLKVISYILVIAVLVQFIEMVLKKMVPTLYRALGIYLPLITTNCAVLGVALINTTASPVRLNFLEATMQGFFGGAGFAVVMLLMSGIRERLEHFAVPRPLQGFPIAFICTALMAIAFLGFAGII